MKKNPEKNIRKDLTTDYYNDSTLLYDTGYNGKPLYTVCLASYNFENSIKQALETLLHQTYKDYEIVMHDDCSTDNTCQVAVNYLKTASDFSAKRIRVYRSNVNGGVLTNRLRGFSRGNGKWLIQTDGDDFSPYNRLEETNRMIEGLDHEPALISTNRWEWFEGLTQEEAIVSGRIPTQTPHWIKLTDIVWQKDMPNGSSGFIVNRKVFETFYDVVPQDRIIADDPVLARRALLLGDVWVDANPLYYCRLSRRSASGGGVAQNPGY